MLSDSERRVHEFVVRRFLACCSQDATGSRSEVEILYGPETFHASGLMVLEKNYLNVYPYEKWTSTDQLPTFRVGETFEPKEARIVEGATTKPGYLTEPELIGLMDANGIGTDATMAEHINKIKGRGYASTRGGSRPAEANEQGSSTRGRGRGRGGRGRGRGRGAHAAEPRSVSTGGGMEEFIPTTLGVALFDGYEKMGFDTSLTKPFLRKEVYIIARIIIFGADTSRWKSSSRLYAMV